jgi:IS66 Orf2 like protein/IS66 C-terminal element/Transposase IS66 family
MIPIPAGVLVWLASGHTDMRKAFDGLALLVQEKLRRDPHGGHLFVFRGRRGGLIKVLWHDGQGLCLVDGRICLTNNAAERQLRGIALGRKSWLFAGSDRGGERAAVMYTLIQTAKLNDVDPQAWLAHVLARINDHNDQNLDQLLPWICKAALAKLAA